MQNINPMRLSDEFLVEFVCDLRNSYDAAVSECGKYAKYTRKHVLVQRALNKPAKCFYVSYDEASRIINKINRVGMSGKKGMNAIKFQDLYRTYQHIMQDNEDIKIKQAIRLACDSPAPRFYISVDRAFKLLNKHICL